jgi:repressor of nif and glnA expression
LTEVVVDFLYLQASLFDAGLHVFRVVHLGIAVGDRCKIEARHRQTE